MKKIFLPLLLLFTAACADRSLDADILNVFERHSYEPFPPQQITGTLHTKGLAGLKLLDRHAEVVSAVRKFRELPGGGGVSSGLLLGQWNGGLYVFKVFQKSPAAAAGLKDGDLVLEINGVPATAKTAPRQLTNRPGFRIKTERRTPKGAATTTTLIKKELFSFPVVFGFYEPTTRTAFVRIGVFFEGSALTVAAGLDVLSRMGAKKVVFDLRDNGGGVPEEAAALLKDLAPKAGPVLEVRSRHKGYSQLFEAPGPGRFSSMKAAVLVNSGTAMAAEAFAAALNEIAGAPLVGEPTRGDVSLVKTFSLGRSKKGLKLTVARFFPPSGKELEEKGVLPSLDPGLTPEQAEGTKAAWTASSETALLGDAAYAKAAELLAK